MYGVPKYREPFWWKHKKEIYMAAAALIAVTAIARFSPEQQMAQNSETIAENQTITKHVKTAYKVIFQGKETGIVETKEEVDLIVEKAYTSLKKKIGYDPEISTKVEIEEVKNVEIPVDYYDTVAKLEIAFTGLVEGTKQKAYVVKIGKEFTVALEDEESAKEVLLRAQKKLLDTKMEVAVDLTAHPYNSLVTTPKLLVFNPEEKERVLVTSGNPTSGVGAIDSILNNVKEKMQDEENIPSEAVTVAALQDEILNDSQESQEVQKGGDNADNSEKLLEVSLPKDVLIAESYVEPDKIVDVETATELLTQNKVEEKVYHVEKGDSPSLIAEKNNMGLSALYQLNPDLKNGNAVIHVGDEIIINAPEPLLKVIAKYETNYTEPILKTVVDEKDPENFVGYSKIKEEGQDGLQNVKAVITKVNGKQVASEVLETEVVSEMRPKIRLVGTKPLPPKAATGTFIYPLKRFILSSKYGYRWGSFHAGIDLAAPRGTTIFASDGGTVTHAGWHSGGYGYMVTVDHGKGVKTLYAHMSKVTCTVGQKVAKGEKIGEVGSTGNSTGNHCHFEIHINGTRVNPSKYL